MSYIKERYRAITKPDPEKYCAYCGKRMERVRFESGRLEDLHAFMRRKYCCRDCMRKDYIKQGKDMGQKYRCAHETAEKIAYTIMGKPKVCEICGSTRAIDVHHKDGNRNNNTQENLIVVCRSCHMKLHRPKGVCKICGQPMKGHGYCNKHLIRFKKYGNPFMLWGKRVSD